MRRLLASIFVLLTATCVACESKRQAAALPEKTSPAVIEQSRTVPHPSPGVADPCAEPVVLHASTSYDGLVSENAWLAAHYPGYQKAQSLSRSLPDGASNGQRHFYDEVTLVKASGDHVTVCFDITSFYGKR